jgi:redox-sensitive bicupin YhaK (pirin superfamily)
VAGKRQQGTVRIVTTHADLSDPDSHLLMPTAEQGPFPPFDRFAETVASAGMRPGLHPHLTEEVLVYILDGNVHHVDGKGQETVLSPGAVLLITAHQEIRHELTPQSSKEGASARWISLVLRLPWHTEAPPTSVQIKTAGDAAETTDGSLRRPLVGPLARADSSMGLECTDIEFPEAKEASVQIGRSRRGVAYVLRGTGMIDKGPVEPGRGALFENVARLTLSGSSGFRVLLASVPITDVGQEAGPGRERSPRA